VTQQPTANISGAHIWKPTKEFDDFVELCGCDRPHLNLLSDPDLFSSTQRGGRMGSVSIQDAVFDADTSIDCGEFCSTYRVFVVRSGRAAGVHRGLPAGGCAGTAAVYAPEGLSALQWDASTEILLFKMNRHAVEDALSDPDGLVHQPLVGMPFVDSLVRGFLVAAEHSHRNALLGLDRRTTPRAIRTAIDVIEAEAQLPLTLSSIAARSQMSVRALQQGFKRHLGMSPMSYLREVRLRRAHQTLIESDPSVVTVASVAYDWGFTNLGRFAAAHAARYREPPAKTLRRTA
jgi:AraC-like DNA-binding protein